MSKTNPWIAFYPADFIADTMHLTHQQHAVYHLLLMHYWRTGPLPDDNAVLATIARLTPKAWAAIAPVIRAFFTTEDGKLHQKRADIELAKRSDLTSKRSAAGKAGADAKWSQPDGTPPDKPSGKTNGKSDGKPIANAQKSMANEWQTHPDATGFANAHLQLPKEENLPLLASPERNAREEESHEGKEEGIKIPIFSGEVAHAKPEAKPVNVVPIRPTPALPNVLEKEPVGPARTRNEQIDAMTPKRSVKTAYLTPDQLRQARQASSLYPPSALFVRKGEK